VKWTGRSRAPQISSCTCVRKGSVTKTCSRVGADELKQWWEARHHTVKVNGCRMRSSQLAGHGKQQARMYPPANCS
jgi:hypothetical protein